jgi:hypothetical protein
MTFRPHANDISAVTCHNPSGALGHVMLLPNTIRTTPFMQQSPMVLSIATRAFVFRAVYTSSRHFSVKRPMSVRMSGDLNNTDAARAQREIETDLSYRSRSFAIPASQDDAVLRQSYRPYLLDDTTTASDWIAQLELSTALKMVDTQILNGGQERLRVLILYGSLRQR